MIAEDDQGYETRRGKAQIQTRAEKLVSAKHGGYGQTAANHPGNEDIMVELKARSKSVQGSLTDIRPIYPSAEGVDAETERVKSKTEKVSSGNESLDSKTETVCSNRMIQTVIQANNQAAEAWFDGWRQLLDNAAEFTSRRVNRDLETVDALFSCKTPIEALRVQTEFLRTAFQDYLQELTRLGEIETEAGAASIEALQRSVRDVETKGPKAAE